MRNAPRFRLRPIDAIDILVPLVGSVEDDVIFSVCVDREGFVGLSECFRWPRDGGCEPPIDALFELPIDTKAAGVLFASRTHRPIQHLYESDIEFTRRLIAHGRSVGVLVFDHILIERDMFRLMSESIGAWSTTPGPASI